MKALNVFQGTKIIAFLLYFTCITILILISGSCSQEDDTPALQGDNYSINDISGKWIAMQAGFTSMEVPDKGFLDVIAEGGTLTITIQSNGRFSMTIVLPQKPDQVFTGQLGFDEEWLAVSYDEAPGDYDYHYFDLNADKTVLTIRGQGTYDFDEDGEEDSASFSFILAKS
jgi:hypothetical protein